AHLPVDEAAMARALCLREERTVGNDHCVSFEAKVLQLDPQRKQASLAGKKVRVERVLDGSLRVMWRGEAVPHQVGAHRPRQARQKQSLEARVAAHQEPYKPPASHPWRGPARS